MSSKRVRSNSLNVKVEKEEASIIIKLFLEFVKSNINLMKFIL